MKKGERITMAVPRTPVSRVRGGRTLRKGTENGNGRTGATSLEKTCKSSNKKENRRKKVSSLAVPGHAVTGVKATERTSIPATCTADGLSPRRVVPEGDS